MKLRQEVLLWTQRRHFDRLQIPTGVRKCLVFGQLRPIVGGDRKLLFDPQDFLWCMFAEEALHIRGKFA